LNGGFETAGGGGDDVFANWTETKASGTIADETVDMYSGAHACRMDVDAGGSLLRIHQAAVLTAGKAYRVVCYAKADSITNTPKLYVEIGGLSAYALATLTTSYARYEKIATADGIYLYFERGSGCAGRSLYIDDVTVTRVGAILDWDLTIGKGYWVPDRSTNLLWADIQLTGVTHKYERQAGEFCIQRYFAHGDISVVALSTTLMTLPPNCCILDVEFDRESAFDAGIVLDIGHATDVDHYVDDESVDATGKLLVDSLDKASKVATGNTTIYIQKSGATTTGATTVRVRCGIRG
jgi:hypothetical protein